MNTILVKILLFWKYKNFGKELSTHFVSILGIIMSRKGNSSNNNTSHIKIALILSTDLIIPRPSSVTISPLPSVAAITPLPSA